MSVIDNKDAVGSRGETLAKEYLQNNGFVIRHINWRYGHKELDIVASKRDILHIVEVKTRTIAYWEEPKAAVVHRKQKNMLVAAEAYILQHNVDMETQFDVISIIIGKDDYNLEYIPNAFLASEIQ